MYRAFLLCSCFFPWFLPSHNILAFQKWHRDLWICCWPFKRSIHLCISLSLFIEMNGNWCQTLPLQTSIFGRWAERSYSVLYFTPLNNLSPWHSTLGKYHGSERFISNVIIYCSHTASKLPCHQESPGPFPWSTALPHYSTSYLTTYFWAHLHARKSGFLSPGGLAGTLQSDSSCTQTSDTQLPKETYQRSHVNDSLGNFTSISVD